MPKKIIEPSTGVTWPSARAVSIDIGCSIHTMRQHLLYKNPKTIFGQVFHYMTAEGAVGPARPSREWRFVLVEGKSGRPEKVRVYEGSHLLREIEIAEVILTEPAADIGADAWQWRVWNVNLNKWSDWMYGRLTEEGQRIKWSRTFEERPLYALETLGAIDG